MGGTIFFLLIITALFFTNPGYTSDLEYLFEIAIKLFFIRLFVYFFVKTLY